MDTTARFPIRRYDGLEAIKAAEYAYWQARPAHERTAAVAEITAATYGLEDPHANAPRLQRTLVHLKR